ncbi:MAG TPA: hypothetical protein VFV34_25235 [Blastocatellia bacterium]|nr:hypothetical protein [Blastocatellia bacterium]
MDQLDEALATLGYDRRWLTYGFLTADDVTRQRQSLAASHDSSPEHCRYDSFRRILTTRSRISDDDVARYVELAEVDPNPAMAGSALGELLTWAGLTAGQFEGLAGHRAYQAEFLQRLARRRRLVEAIGVGPVDDALTQACVGSNDAEVQRALAASHGVSRDALEQLAQAGCNRAVRNLALQRLGQRQQDPPN